MAEPDSTQFYCFKECLARRILSRIAFNNDDDPSELDDFTSYLASEVWPFLPSTMHNASYDTRDQVPDPSSMNFDAMPLPTSFADTLVSYGISPDPETSLTLLKRALEDFVAEECAPLPAWKSTRTTECEICERQIPLTYHHLIPRSTHDKVLKQKWHSETMINSVAWLCRYCHSTVHHVATNEDLARNYYTVELLLQREDIQKWRAYASKQRYGKRRGTHRNPK